jgi:hypothetical protein
MCRAAPTPIAGREAVHRVVYARKGPKTLRWVAGFLSIDAGGQGRLLSDTKKHIATLKDIGQVCRASPACDAA